ncbi:hypothetical protein EW146_g3847 [Bondarzewia mesenterica]|uniref:Transcription initiation factor IIF subunit beta n=1 Tax=Bondarzewia mesenterica TaxID=1095465 RepID=A0A4S4LWV4_9AGAM|nr:hypothetical protein EW146_g3847 [Bondarzewia mesenterica]
MDDIVQEDEKKPFDAELAGHEEETQPDPDEHIMLETGNGRVWVVKIPRFIMDVWSSFNVEGVQLATIRIYHNPQRIYLQIPEDPTDPNSPVDRYELEMVNQDVNNQIVIAEREKEPNSRARTTIMTGKIKHECNLRPTLTESYLKKMRDRAEVAKQQSKPIRRIDEVISGGQGSINRLSSGVTIAAGFADLTVRDSELILCRPLLTALPHHLQKPKAKPAKGQFERMARMPRNQLLDMLFNLYRERAHWPIKQLREKTQQPEVYLKEVLSEIAFLHRSGEFNGTWELKASFKEDGVGIDFVLNLVMVYDDDDAMQIKGEESVAELYKAEPPEAQAFLEDGMDEDEEDEDDMEEVS